MSAGSGAFLHSFLHPQNKIFHIGLHVFVGFVYPWFVVYEEFVVMARISGALCLW